MPLRLLVVEDRLSDFELLEQQLVRQGLDASCHRVDSLEALEAALGQGAWDAVLTDYSLPELPFQRTLARVRARQPQLPIVLVSGYMGEDQAAELLKAGIDDFVLKYRPARLAASIRRAVSEARLKQERRAAEEALRASEERLRLALEGAELGLLRFDCVAETFHLDARAQRQFGLGPEVSRAALRDRIHAEDLVRIDTLLAAAAAPDSDGRYAVEFRIEDAGGARWLSFCGAIHFGFERGERRALEHVGVVQDITERKRIENALHACEARLERAQRALDAANLRHSSSG